MRKIGILLIGILFLPSCWFFNSASEEKKVLIEGTTYVDLNVRATPDADGDRNILDDLKPGDIVQIVEFDTESEDGIYWCQIKLDRTETYGGEEITCAWVAYKTRDLPFIVSNTSWIKIERMYEMEYEKDFNEILKGSKTWLTQAIYDYVYNEPLRDIKYEYDLRGPEEKYEDGTDNPKDKYVTESPSHSVDFDDDQYCRVRITTASSDRDETALYAVVFNQTPRSIHFFRQDDRSQRGKFIYSQDFSHTLNSSIKNIERKTKKSRVYISDYYYGDKTRLDLNYDAIRIRPRSGRERYIVHNTSGYTNANMDGVYLSITEEY
tara:strand:+ start:154 stop:1119 length:966 start_codon:yes stop_codon:yes gene_type:complete